MNTKDSQYYLCHFHNESSETCPCNGTAHQAPQPNKKPSAKPLAAEALRTQQIDGETLYLSPIGDRWKLTIEPANKRNGTQQYDGWFPRYYTTVGTAKAAVTRKLGREWKWRIE